jgi:hypothetical protein
MSLIRGSSFKEQQMPAHGNYKTAAVVAATKIPIETFYRWLDRRVIPLSRDDVPGNGRGKPRRFCVRTVTKLAIAHRISQLGIPANIAVALASQFTDTPQIGRPIGGVFPGGLTYILATPDGVGSVVNVQADEDIGKFLQDATIVVNVSQIISSINFEIGIIK